METPPSRGSRSGDWPLLRLTGHTSNSRIVAGVRECTVGRGRVRPTVHSSASAPAMGGPTGGGRLRWVLEFQPSATRLRAPFGVTLGDAASWGEKTTICGERGVQPGRWAVV